MLFPILITAGLGWWAWRIIKRENECPLCTSKGFCHTCWIKYMRKLMEEGTK